VLVWHGWALTCIGHAYHAATFSRIEGQSFEK
jgi:hypothetical protein